MMQQTLCHELSMELRAGGAAAWDGGSESCFVMGCDGKSWQLLSSDPVYTVHVIFALNSLSNTHRSIPETTLLQEKTIEWKHTKPKASGWEIEHEADTLFGFFSIFSPFFDLLCIG